MEVPFCGHAIVAAAVTPAERIGQGELVFETSVGTVPVRVTETGGWLRATLTSVEPRVENVTESDVAEAPKLPGWAPGELDPALPPRIAYAGGLV